MRSNGQPDKTTKKERKDAARKAKKRAAESGDEAKETSFSEKPPASVSRKPLRPFPVDRFPLEVFSPTSKPSF
jgi:hypothetical protein